MVSLPLETFAPFGANIKTSVLVARKWRRGEGRADHPVFLARSENIGHDAAGRPLPGADLPAIADAFGAFVAAHGW